MQHMFSKARRWGALGASVLWLACSAGAERPSPLSAASPECEAYVQAFARCYERFDPDRATLSRQLDAMRRGLQAQAGADDENRSDLGASCSAAMTQLPATCQRLDAAASL